MILYCPIRQLQMNFKHNRKAAHVPSVHPPKSVANKKLLSEAEALAKNPVPGCVAVPRDDDILIWTAVVDGPTGSLYEGGTFFIQLRFDEDYPFTPPDITFLTRIYHCNIDNEGRTNLPIINSDWSPCNTIADILKNIQSLMQECQPDISIVTELGEQFLTKPEAYKTIAKEWTRRYAH